MQPTDVKPAETDLDPTYEDKVVKALLADCAAYMKQPSVKVVEDAIAFAKKHHTGQTRQGGQPYYTHPVEVARILVDYKLDLASIITAILHDTVEDTNATLDDIKKQFGADVAGLVDGVTKLSKIESKTVEGKQAENFRKLLLAMSEDIRVLLVKLADRLHNIRTLGAVAKLDKRQRIALETLEIYAPLAERIGIHKIKEELEDTAFGYLRPEARESIAARLAFLRSGGADITKQIIHDLNKLLKDSGVIADINGREKSKYSIWKKMQRKNVAFEQLSDIMAFRIVVDTVADCYHALGIIHFAFPTVPGRFKDYISTPKSNGYKSIHTTVLGPLNQRIEIQIRTRDMHNESELGVAAHWAYKQGNLPDTEDIRKFRWMRDLLDILEQEQKPEEFLENTKLSLFQDMVYCFTPKGDLVELPSGATPVDFAYGIHSNVGDHCVAAKVNGRIAPLNSKLSNGDQVDIQVSKNQTPNPTWERFVITGKARSHIRRFIRQQQRDQYVVLGRAMVQKYWKGEGLDFNNDKILQPFVGQQKTETVEDVLSGVGSGNLACRDVFKFILPNHKHVETAKDTAPPIDKPQTYNKPGKASNNALPIKGLIPGMAVHYARCCHPLPGDRIVGIVTTGKGVTVHTHDCDTLETFADTPERWLDVSWGESTTTEAHVGRLSLTLSNESGGLAALSTLIAKNGGNITNLKITSRTTDFWDMYVDVQVNDIKHLNTIMAALRSSSLVTSIDRAKN